MLFYASFGSATRFTLAHKAAESFADTFLHLIERKREFPREILKVTPYPEIHHIEVVIASGKASDYKTFFPTQGLEILKIHTVSTARPILQGPKKVAEILPATCGITPEDMELE